MSLPDPIYLSLRRGRLFCIRYTPPAQARGSVLFVHAFAEEMNKSRRMVALQSRALAQSGWNVLLPDLYGCGDSDGDFSQAAWSAWRDDVRDAAEWWRVESGHAPVFWGMRAGCLLACEAARDVEAARLLFWQPQVSGAQALQQFLRLRVAQQALASSQPGRVTTKDLREALVRGESLDVAGYTLSPDVALGLDAARLELPPSATRVAWLELASESDNGPTATARAQVEAWRSAGVDASVTTVQGPAFWQSQEIAESEALANATVSAVAAWSP